jgi:hypothetical protein
MPKMSAYIECLTAEAGSLNDCINERILEWSLQVLIEQIEREDGTSGGYRGQRVPCCKMLRGKQPVVVKEVVN